MKSKQKIVPEPGQVLAIPLRDGTFGLGQVTHVHAVARSTYALTCALFAVREPSLDELRHLDWGRVLAHPFIVLSPSQDVIVDGVWPVIGHHSVRYDNVDVEGRLKAHLFDGQLWTGNAATMFIEMYFGLLPWDGLHDPQGLQKLLLPGYAVPATARYRRDFDPDWLSSLGYPPRAGEASRPPPVRKPPPQGRGTLHIQILYPGNALPTPEQLGLRHRLEETLEASGVGSVIEAGGGEGVLDIYLESAHTSRAMLMTERIVEQLGLDPQTLIEVV